jgi:hypothetical protein
MSNASDFIIENGVLTKYVGPGGDVVIPEGVTEVGLNAFFFCENIISITFARSVTALGIEPIAYCGNLQSLTIPKHVTQIGANLCAHCDNLYSVTISAEISELPAGAFRGCGNLQTVTLPESVTSVGDKVFEECQALKVLYAPGLSTETLKAHKLLQPATVGFLLNPEQYQNADLVQAYQKYANSQKKKLLPILFSMDAAQSMEVYAQAGLITPKNVDGDFLQPAMQAGASLCAAFLLNWKNDNIAPKQAETLQKQALTRDPYNAADMKKLWSTKALDDGTLMITGYKGLETQIEIPPYIGKRKVSSIGEYALSPFKEHITEERANLFRRLQAVRIPEGITVVGECAFFGCEELCKLELPQGVICQSGSFGNCIKLADPTGALIVGNVLFKHYGASGKLHIAQNVTKINSYAFMFQKNLEAVVLPENVTEIGDQAFRDCGKLKYIFVPASVRSIGWMAFADCPDLTIHTPAGSYAETYAKENNIPFVAE